MLVTPDLIHRLETTDAAWLELAVSAGAGEVLRLGEGVAAYAGPGNVLTQTVALRSSEHFEAVLAHYRGRCESFEFKVSPLADPQLRKLAAQRADDLPELDSVLVRSLESVPEPVDLPVEELPKEELRDYVVRSMGWFYADAPPPGFVDTITAAASLEISRHFVVREGGVPVAGAALTIMSGLAFLHGGAVDPGYRGRGYHKALIAHRLRLARELGADLASQGAQPGSISQQNAQRNGFEVAYTRPTLMVRP